MKLTTHTDSGEGFERSTETFVLVLCCGFVMFFAYRRGVVICTLSVDLSLSLLIFPVPPYGESHDMTCACPSVCSWSCCYQTLPSSKRHVTLLDQAFYFISEFKRGFRKIFLITQYISVNLMQ